METRTDKPVIIVALDVEDGAAALDLAGSLVGKVPFFKVGSRLFTAEGPGMIGRIKKLGASVFLDLKYHDIPATVAGSVRAAAGLGIDMLTLHTMGGVEMMRAAAGAALEGAEMFGGRRPLLVGVTVLTSMSREDLSAIAPVGGSVRDLVLKLAGRAREAGLDGVVASVEEAAAIKERFGRDFIVVTPGIRPAGGEKGDQKRVATPAQAAEAGSDYLVIGRPIIKASSPPEAAAAILKELEQV